MKGYVFDQHCPVFPLSGFWQPQRFCSVSMSLAYLHSLSKWNHMVFVCLWLSSLSVEPSRSIHIVVNGRISFSFMAEYSSVCVIICVSVDGHLGCLHILAVEKAAVNMRAELSFWWGDFISFGGKPRSGIAGSYVSAILKKFLRNIHILPHSGCTSVHYHQWCTGFPFLHLLSLIFLMIAILTGMRWYLSVVFFLFQLLFKFELSNT